MMMAVLRRNTTGSADLTEGRNLRVFRHLYPPADKKMQRLLVALCLGAASAFAPQQLTQNSLVRLQANPIDIYSTAAARNCETSQTFVGAAVIELLRCQSSSCRKPGHQR